MIELKVARLCEEAVLPRYQTKGASGFDLHSVEEKTIAAGGFGTVKTGLAFEIPLGFEIQVRGRSGLAFRSGIGVLNAPGTIDSDYRGEVVVILFNFSKTDFVIKKGDRIAQAVVAQVVLANLNVVENLATSERADKGFGSTGV